MTRAAWTLRRPRPKVKRLSGPCARCGQRARAADFCYGCRAYIHDNCDRGGLFGSHAPSDHWENP